MASSLALKDLYPQLSSQGLSAVPSLRLPPQPPASSTPMPFVNTMTLTPVNSTLTGALLLAAAISSQVHVFDPFSPTRSLSQVLNLVDQMTENPLFAGTRGGLRRGWDAKEDEDALNLRIDMPGLGKEDVKVSVEQSTLVIKGEGGKEGDDEETVRRYTSRIDLPEKMYKTDSIKAEMKNGVLKVVVPKVKEEERSDVVHVSVE
ncbi:hypothetical protein Pint_17215 [Pistacia integerrima]|uniref:Uncharacterized protein n=1 Tax=Pistacia integerrima TaxID=434235 RepID=A0ACC0YZK0_9ROSI|nr:hypothetical protein Pint_17215 [Pistacia integerrima]